MKNIILSTRTWFFYLVPEIVDIPLMYESNFLKYAKNIELKFELCNEMIVSMDGELTLVGAKKYSISLQGNGVVLLRDVKQSLWFFSSQLFVPALQNNALLGKTFTLDSIPASLEQLNDINGNGEGDYCFYPAKCCVKKMTIKKDVWHLELEEI